MSDTTINVPNPPPLEPESVRRAEEIEHEQRDPLAIALYVNSEPPALTIQLPIGERVHLGRNPSSSVPPLAIDLTGYLAFENGVSRVHAALERLSDGSIVMEDLGSSNGTHLNGLRLTPHVRVMLTSGNYLLLARLGIQVYFQSAMGTVKTTEPEKSPQHGSPQEKTTTPQENRIDNASGRISTLIQRHPFAVNALVFSPDNRYIVSGSKDGIIQIWDVIANKLFATLQTAKSGVNALVFSPDGKYLVSGGEGGVIQVWDVATSKLLSTLQVEKSTVNALAFSPDGKYLISGGEGGVMQVWDVADTKLLSALQGPLSTVKSLVVSSDRRYLAAAGEDGAVHLWKLATAALTAP